MNSTDAQFSASVPDRRANDLVTPAAAAERLSVSPKVLERWRGTGEGPAYVKLSSKTIRYRLEDVDAFVAARKRSSTAAQSAPS